MTEPASAPAAAGAPERANHVQWGVSGPASLAPDARLGTSGAEGPPEPETAQFGRRLRWPDAILALGIGTAVMVLAWFWRAALIPIDPWDYVEGAINFPDGVWNEVGLSRWAMLAPIMVFASWWGDAEATYYAYPLLAAGLLAGVLYLIGARLVNRATGVAGAMLTMTTPVVFVHLSRGYPDLIALAFVASALLCLLLARDAGAGWRWVGYLLLAGGCVGWAFEVRELTALAWPALGVALLRVGRPVRAFLLFAILPVLAITVDVYLSARYFGDPLLKINALTGNSIDQSSVAADAVYLGHDRWYYLSIPFRMLWLRSAGPALVVAAGVGLVGGALLWRQLGAIWLWGASVLGLLLAAGGSLRPAAPSIRLDILRYSFAYLVPLVLTAICVFGVLLIRNHGWRRLVLGLAAAALALAGVVPTVRFMATFEGLVPNGGNALREMGQFLATRPDVATAQIWGDWGTQRLVPVYSVSPTGAREWAAADYRSLNRLLRDPPVSPSRRPQPGDYVVVYSRGDDTCYHCGQALLDLEAAYGQFPLPGWQEVFSSSAGNLVLYQIPPGFNWPEPAAGAASGNGSAQSEGTEAP